MIGQRNLTSRLGALIRLKKLPRFIILVGEVGSGRRTVAKWLADEMSADFIEVDKSVEAVREVVEKCYMASGATVYFIADGDTLSNPAKSALLKITEEPPKNAYFVMSTTDAENVLPTLVSRAFVYRMDSYSIADIAEFLNDPKADLRAYANCCTNGREVNLVKQWGKEFFDFVTLVIDNIADVSGSNALKMENRIILGIDVSTACLGVSLAKYDGKDIEILKISHVKPKTPSRIKGTEALFLKTKQFKEKFQIPLLSLNINVAIRFVLVCFAVLRSISALI